MTGVLHPGPRPASVQIARIRSSFRSTVRTAHPQLVGDLGIAQSFEPPTAIFWRVSSSRAARSIWTSSSRRTSRSGVGSLLRPRRALGGTGRAAIVAALRLRLLDLANAYGGRRRA